MTARWSEEPLATRVLRAALTLGTASFRELLLMRGAHNCTLRWGGAAREAPVVERSEQWDRLRIAVDRAVVWGRTRSVLRLLSAFAWLARERDAHQVTTSTDPAAGLALVRLGDGVWEATREGEGGTCVRVRARLVGTEWAVDDYRDALAVLPVLYGECPRLRGADPQPQTALALGQ